MIERENEAVQRGPITEIRPLRGNPPRVGWGAFFAAAEQERREWDDDEDDYPRG
ncbi:hypothetical protein [Streptomyces globosus]|uniref:hypothetical protein n=1 Tax=Streptomyces globosus TaxID=68209 RepID=UPI0013B45EF8|nr:hypothetical protein [Streptomyces globosus]